MVIFINLSFTEIWPNYYNNSFKVLLVLTELWRSLRIQSTMDAWFWSSESWGSPCTRQIFGQIVACRPHSCTLPPVKNCKPSTPVLQNNWTDKNYLRNINLFSSNCIWFLENISRIQLYILLEEGTFSKTNSFDWGLKGDENVRQITHFLLGNRLEKSAGISNYVKNY